MKMINWFVACLPLLTSAIAHTAPTDAREQQWKTITPVGQHSPTAVFLSWDGSEVVFTVRCDSSTKEIVIRYTLQASAPFDPAYPIAIGDVAFRTTKTGEVLEGRSQLTSHLKSALNSHSEIQIQAPNDMDEPWYVGIAGPLRRVALACH